MLTADEIRSHTFLTALRGYDRDEVKAFLSHVAAFVDGLQGRVRELEQASGAAAAPVAADVAEVAGADDAGTEVAIGDDARPPAAGESAAPAEGEDASPFAEIARDTQRVLEAAQAAADDIRRRAREDADRETKAARAQAARIIAEGERRREALERVVDALTSARGELSEDLRAVGRTIERVLRELGPEPAAATVREALAATARGEPDETAEGSSGGDDTTEGPSGDDADTPGEGDGSPTPGVAGAELADGQSNGEVVASSGGAGAPARARPGDDAASDTAVLAAAAAGEVGVEEADAAGDAEAVGDGQPVEGADAADGAGEPGADEPAADGEVAGAGAGEAGGAEGADTAATGSRGDAGATAEPAPRAQVLASLHPRLVRRLKRGLQDLQNATLDTLRRDPHREDVEPFLPDAAAVRSLSGLAEDQLTMAHAAGLAAGQRVLGGVEVDLAPSGSALADQVSSELGGVLVTRLADALRSGFDAGEAFPTLATRVDAVFTRIKNGPAADVAAVALARAYEGGQKDAWSAAGVSHLRWVRGTEPPCTDPRCVDNESAGPVPLGERFPSRHDAPPVRPGCSCSMAPSGA